MENIVPVSFKCRKCNEVITLGVLEGKTLNGLPPGCLYCGSLDTLEPTDQHLPLIP